MGEGSGCLTMFIFLGIFYFIFECQEEGDEGSRGLTNGFLKSFIAAGLELRQANHTSIRAPLQLRC